MTEQLAGLFGSAVGMLASSRARSFELFTEITTLDESACDAWVGRIRCGDTDRVTLFRAWYSRSNFGQLAGSAEISMNSLNARIPIGGMFGDITYPINSPLAITMGFAVHEASVGNYADAMEALEDVPSTGAEHLVSWVKAVIYGAAERWTDVIDEVQGCRRLAGQVPRCRGRCGARSGSGQPRTVHRGRTPSDRVEFVACGRGMRASHRLVSGDDAPQPGQRRGRGGAAGVAAGHPFGAESLCGAEGSGIPTGDHHAGEDRCARATRGIPPASRPTTSGREKLLAEAQADLDRQIGLTRVKEQIEAYRAATQMAKIRAARGMKVAQASKHMIFAGPPGTGKTTIARVVANILAGLGVIAEPKLVEIVPQGLRRRVRRAVGGEDQPNHRPGRRRGAVHRRGVHTGAGARRPRRPVRHRGTGHAAGADGERPRPPGR